MVKQFITMPALDVTPHNDLENEQPVPKWIRTQKRRPWHLPNPVVSTLIFLLPSFIVNRFRKTTPSRIHPTAYLDGLRGIAALFVYVAGTTNILFGFRDEQPLVREMNAKPPWP